MLTKEIQEWLCLHGHVVSIDGDLGPATRAAIRAFQLKNALPVTGAIDEKTAAFLTHPLAAASNVVGLPCGTFAEALLSVARHYLSYSPKEVGGENKGPWVRHFMRGQEGAPRAWCCGCVCTLMRAASLLIAGPNLAYTTSCDILAVQAQTLGLFRTSHEGLNPGSLFLLKGKQPGDWIHVGVVTEFGSDYFTTIEGNTNDEGSREGYEMCARTRSYKNVDFISI